jgi:uncharacterized membrane protein
MGGCLFGALAALLALAIPASIARTSLVGAYVVIGLLTAVAVIAILGRMRWQQRSGPVKPTRTALTRIAIAAVVYAGVVTAIHFAG